MTSIKRAALPAQRRLILYMSMSLDGFAARHDGAPGSTSPTGELMNALGKVVFSSTLTELDWSNTRVSSRAVEEEIPELKAQPGKHIVVFGGVSFARALAAHGLIDEYRINVQTVALGDGLPLLHGLPEPQPLELVASTAWADGPITQT